MPETLQIKFDQEAYVEARADMDERVNDLVSKFCFFAFDDKQFEEGCARFEDELDAGDRLTRIGGGGFCLKSHLGELTDALKASKTYIRNRMLTEPDFARGAFLYEMRNHEYYINWQGDWDVCDCFSIDSEPEFKEYKTYVHYLEEIGLGRCKTCYSQAAQEYMRLARENNWC